MRGNTDRITGPHPFVPDPDREGWSIEHLEGAGGQGTDCAPLGELVALARRCPTGARMLRALSELDVWVAPLDDDEPSFGYFLSADRVVHVRTSDPWQGVRTLLHEARHAVQTAHGFSTIVECYEPGTLLPFDGAGYLLLNRVVEADADAVAVQASRELGRLVDPGAWRSLEQGSEFGPLAAAYREHEDRGSAAAMRATYDRWFSMGRAYGYDVYLLDWLERLVERHGPIRAAASLADPTIRELVDAGVAWSYLEAPSAKGPVAPLDGPAYTHMAADVRARVLELPIRTDTST